MEAFVSNYVTIAAIKIGQWGIFEEGDFRFQTISTSGVKLKQRNIASLWGKLKHKKGSGNR